MTLEQELQAVMHTLAALCWAKGAQQPLQLGDIGIAVRGLQPELDGPLKAAQALVLGAAWAGVAATVDELNGRGIVSINPDARAELLASVPRLALSRVEVNVEFGGEETRP